MEGLRSWYCSPAEIASGGDINPCMALAHRQQISQHPILHRTKPDIQFSTTIAISHRETANEAEGQAGSTKQDKDGQGVA